MTPSARLNIDSEFLRFSEYLVRVTGYVNSAIAARQGCVYCTGSQEEEEETGGCKEEGEQDPLESWLLLACLSCACFVFYACIHLWERMSMHMSA